VKTGFMLSFALLAMSGCGGEEASIPCTAMGCVDGVLVQLQDPPNEPYTVEATAPGETPQVQTCATRNCPTFIFRFMPQSISVRVVLTASGATWGTASATLTYGRVFPNGPRCAGDCVQSSITVRAGP
jgi:hypothetical protein